MVSNVNRIHRLLPGSLQSCEMSMQLLQFQIAREYFFKNFMPMAGISVEFNKLKNEVEISII